ncbi:MAG: tetratricopeptide repeat protein [Planctomycetota bacterium]
MRDTSDERRVERRVPEGSHPRLPAVLVLAATAGVWAAVFLWPAAGGRGGAGGGTAALASLERVIATGRADGATWFAYAEGLRAAGRLAHAAEACRKALELDPFHREARFLRGATLADRGDADALHAYLYDLVLSDAKLTLDLLERPACHPFLADPRFAALHEEARRQAMD